MSDILEARVGSDVVLCCYLHLKRLLDRSKGRYLCLLRFIMILTALQLVQRFPYSSEASNPSDITNMAVGQDRFVVILTFFLDKAVRLPQYVHRTGLDDSHWLHHAGHAGRGFATCPQRHPSGMSAAECALQQPWADYYKIGPSDNLVASSYIVIGSFCIIRLVRRYAQLGDRTVDVRWAVLVVHHKTVTCSGLSGDTTCTHLHTTDQHSSLIAHLSFDLASWANRDFSSSPSIPQRTEWCFPHN
jgi:hypothetical protein